ncbi:protein phosphatase inhibitor 2, putative [Plasmodium gallinaceum]|uniref:Protein phosphatase inhibitor 2, putative n=1 Tax=Plasmodium gallinaceum TaxID=5849 RepID=A0A1J1GT81_PLAGA|nr:protein phosphatase inhibitor 2, putative [Plasmodium gallinaceum]CRG94259.1 protein phosphatase inhibitor 2, putative [Plasmodium gallinaceum]
MKKKIDKSSTKKTISWDEVTINEQDKERGSRMKILEPNTPFNFILMDSASEDEASKYGDIKGNNEGMNNIADDLISKLNQLVEKQESKSSSNIDFKEKRKKHYNEYKMLQELRKSGTFDDIDECALDENDSNYDNNKIPKSEE